MYLKILYVHLYYLHLHFAVLVRPIARAVRAKCILNSQGRKARSTVLEQHLGIVRGTKVRVAVDARIVIEERDR